MFRHFCSHLFQVNKFIYGKVLHSNWHTLETIYGGQFSKILSRNGHSCIKHQELCHRSQFSILNDGIDTHSIESKINSSSTTILTQKTPTNNLIKQKKQQQNLEGTEKLVEDIEIRFFQLDIYNKKQLQLRLLKGRKGFKFLQINLLKNDKYFNFTKIPMPEDAYAFVRALDELILELAAENFEQSVHNIQIIQSTAETDAANHQLGSRLKLKTVEVIGLHHKFQLELILFIKPENDEIDKQISLRLNAINKINAKEWGTFFPLRALPWLRNQMAEILVKHDGTEAIILEAPAQIPKQFINISAFIAPTTSNDISSSAVQKMQPKLLTQSINKKSSFVQSMTSFIPQQKDVFRALPIPNGISSAGHRLNQKRMQPQFVNRKPASFQQNPKMSSAKMQNSNQNEYKYSKMPLPFQQRTNLKRPKVKKPNKNDIGPIDPQMAELDKGIRSLFDFDDGQMEKYRRIMAKRKFSSRPLIFVK